MRKGGKYLGQGTYGCVFDPPLKCVGDAQRNSGVGKIFKNEEELEEEEIQFDKVKIIDPTGKFTVQMKKKCEVHAKTIQPSDEFNKCTLFNKNDKNINSFYQQLILNNKGIDLDKFIGKKFMFMDILDGLINAVEGLVEFEKKNYCHRDLKPLNIIVTQPKHNILYIDFGLSLEYDRVYRGDSMDIISYPYMYYPPEFDLCADKLINTDSTEYVELSHRLHNKYKHLIPLFNSIGLSYDILELQFESFSNYLHSTYKDKFDNDEDIFNIFKNFANKVDVFSFGITLLEIITSANCDFTNMTIIQQDTLKTIIKQAIHFNPIERYDSHQLLDALKNLKTVKKQILKPLPKLSSPILNNKVSVEECQKLYTIKEIREKIDQMKQNGVHKNTNNKKFIKNGSKVEICKRISEFLDPKKFPTSKDNVTMLYCRKYYTVAELKELARKLKDQGVRTNKQGERIVTSGSKHKLCSRTITFLDNKTNAKTIKKGRKPL